ncbi:MAG: ABC transporter permease, partial [Lachnospiraceae bacterium]
MVTKALRKEFYMEIKKSFNRFISIFLIVALGVAFFSGIRATSPDMRMSADSFYKKSRLMDIRVLSTLGLTEEDVEEIRKIDGIQTVMPAYSAD